MQAKAGTDYTLSTVLIILLSLITLSFFYSPGTGDVQFWLEWIKIVDTNGPLGGFEIIQWDYPPYIAIMMFLIAKVSHLFSIDYFTALKLVLTLFLFLTSYLVWVWTKDYFITAIFHFSLLLNSLMLVYIDILTAPFLILSLWALKKRKMAVFTFLYSMACLIKWQPIIIAPFILLYILNIKKVSEWKEVDYRQVMSSVLLPFSIVMIITILLFKTPFLMSFASAVGEEYLSGNALNFSWIMTYFIRIFYHDIFGPLMDGQVSFIKTTSLKARMIPQTFFIITYTVTLLSFFRQKKSFENLIHYSLIGFLAYYIFNTGVHENHLFVPSILAGILFFINREHLKIAAFTIIMSSFNLIIFFGIDGRSMTFSRVVGIDMTLVISLLNVVFFLLIWHSACFRRKRTLSEPEENGLSRKSL